MSDAYKPTPRTRLKRANKRGSYDRETVYAILDAGLLCHIGYVVDGQPFVTPTCHWRDGNRVYWHGSSASRMIRNQRDGIPVCLTVSHLDGLVMARSGFHHSVNYRSVMMLGQAEVVEGRDAKEQALEVMMERIAPGRWGELRPATTQEIKGTTVLAMEIDEVSAKVRAGDPVDDEPDYDLDVWAGVIPITTKIGKPISDPRLKKGIEVPGNVKKFRLG